MINGTDAVEYPRIDLSKTGTHFIMSSLVLKNIIGETKFPGNTYAHHLCFVGKKGLYISENNENNPQFDENKLVFRCFTLQDRKK